MYLKKDIYQIQLSLNGSKPRIWRRLVIASNILLADFHKVIQTAMGWENYHLHHFVVGDVFYAPKTKGDLFWDDMNDIDYKKALKSSKRPLGIKYWSRSKK
jgi:hypothetical protein